MKKVWFLDGQTDCSAFVSEDVNKLWRFHELGNDHYMFECTIRELEDLNGSECEVEEWFNKNPENPDTAWGWIKVPLNIDNLIEYLNKFKISDDETIILHYWW